MVFVRVQDLLPENQVEAHEGTENDTSLKTVEKHGDEQKSHLSAAVNPLPCTDSAEITLLDDVEHTCVMEQDFSSWRLGLAVTKKTGCAVQRNRVKRVLREFYRLHQHELPDNVDIVVVPKRHLRPRRVCLHYVTQELLPLFVDIRQFATRKLTK